MSRKRKNQDPVEEPFETKRIAEEDEEEKNVVLGMRSLIENASKVLLEARNLIKEYSYDEFVSTKIGCLGKLIALYSKWFSDSNVMTRKDMEDLVKKHFRSMNIQEHFEELLEFETDYTSFLMEVDKGLSGSLSSEPLVVGNEGPLDYALHSRKIEAAEGEVIVISFGVKEMALKWLEETECNYKLLLDPERKVYCALGLKRSAAKTWSVESITYYGEQIRASRQLPKVYAGVEDDPHQMGGDFIINSSGKLVFSYCSKIPQDRPTIDTLLDVLKMPNA